MIYVANLFMKILLSFSVILCLYSVGNDAIVLNARRGDTWFVNGSAVINLNIAYPNQNGNGSKDINITLPTNSEVIIDEGTVDVGRSVLLTYPMDGLNSASMVIDMRLTGSLFYIHQVNFTYVLNSAHFVGLDEAYEGVMVNLSTNIRPKFQTPIGHVFVCKTKIPMDMTNGSKLTFTSTEFRAFDNSTVNWDTVSREVCPRDFVSKPDVRIATGSAFGALIVAAIIGTVILNCRKSDSG